MSIYQATIGSTTTIGNKTIYHMSVEEQAFKPFGYEVVEGQTERVFRTNSGVQFDMDEATEPGMSQAISQFVDTFAWHRERIIHKSYDEITDSEADDKAAEAAGHATISITDGQAEVEIESF